MQEQNEVSLTKKQNSYTYWVKPTNPDVKINIAPVKIENPLTQTRCLIDQISKQQAKGLGPSIWNSSGTWQERKISTKEFEERLKEVFKDYKTIDNKAIIESVSATGDVSIYFSRGKKGVAYQLKITLSYKGTEGFEDASGDFNFQEFTDHGDRQTTISSKGEKNKQTVKKSIIDDRQKYIQIIESELNRYKE